MRSPGHALDEDTRAFMEPRFGVDLSGVRVHTDARAAESARAVQAHAYTVGQDIVFAPNRFAPGTGSGRELLAHELAHTVQQRGGDGAAPLDAPGSLHESTARSAASDVVAGNAVNSSLPSAGVGLSRSPDDERAKAVAEAEAMLKKMEEDEAETARQEAEDEAKAERRRQEILHPSMSLIKHDPKFEASQITDEQIYNTPDQLREKAVAEAEALLKKWEEEEKEEAEADQAQQEAEEQSRAAIFQSPSWSLHDDPLYQESMQLEAEIQELTREKTPADLEYWERLERDEPESLLDTPILIGNETKYVRRWREVTIEGVGDQGDRTEHVPNHYWQMSGSGLRGYLEYIVGPLTPFEESLTRGGPDLPTQFTPVDAGGELGYYEVTGGSGNRHHKIYNRDGSIHKEWYSEAALINMGIGPLVLLLPGVRPGLKQAGTAVGRGGLAAGRTAIRAGRRVLKPVKKALQKAAISTRLAIGRAEAGAVSTAPTALGGFASRNSVTLVTGRSGAASVSSVAADESAVAAVTSSTARAASTSATTRVAATESTATTAGATTTGAEATLPAAAIIGDAIPQEIAAESSSEITAPISNMSAPMGEEVGDYIINGDKGLVGSTFERNILGLRLKVPTPKDSPIRIGPIMQLFRLMIAEAKAAGATELRITGLAIRNPNVMKLQAFIEKRFGGRATTLGGMTKEFVIPVR